MILREDGETGYVLALSKIVGDIYNEQIFLRGREWDLVKDYRLVTSNRYLAFVGGTDMNEVGGEYQPL